MLEIPHGSSERDASAKAGVSRMRVARIIAMLIAVVAVALTPQLAEACNPDKPYACFRTLNLTLMEPLVLPEVAGSILVPIDTTVTVETGETGAPFSVCNEPSTVTDGLVEITIDCGPAGSFVGTQPLAPQPTPGLHLIPVTVDVLIDPPAPLPAGTNCTLFGRVEADFTEDMQSPPNCAATLEARANSVVCSVEEGDLPGLPRLIMTLSNANPGRCGPGMALQTDIDVFNADFTDSVTIEFTATNNQQARRPAVISNVQTGSCFEQPEESSISAPDFGDDFSLCFLESLPDPDAVAPLPAHPLTYDHQAVAKTITIDPGATETVNVVVNSHPMCADGSCALVDFTAVGFFCASPPCTTGDPISACVSASLNLERGSNCPDARFPAACCFKDGDSATCQDLLPVDCATMGGDVADAYSACANADLNEDDYDDACQPILEDRFFPEMACCFEDGSCTIETGLECANAGGTGQGIGETTCPIGGCPFLDYCCFPSGVCQKLLPDVCASSAGSDPGVLLTLGQPGGSTELTWTAAGAPGTVSYNVYRGDVADFFNLGPAALPVVCKDGVLTGLTYLEVDPDPPVGEGVFYVVSLDNGAEGGMGFGLGGALRTTSVSCP